MWRPEGVETVAARDLFIARAEVLAVSDLPLRGPVTRPEADAAIQATIRMRGGVRGCVAALAYEFGEHPETAAERMRRARAAVTSAYDAA